MPEGNTTIKYWIADGCGYPLFYEEDGQQAGLYAEMLEALTERTGREAERIKIIENEEISSRDAMDMLARGELELVLGLPEGINAADAVGASCTLYENALTAIILKDSPQVPQANVGSCYWAAEASSMHLLEGTVLEGHTLDYGSRAELFTALEAGDVYGIFIKRSEWDLIAEEGGTFEYREYEGIRIPCAECAYVNASDTGLCAAADEICDELAEKYAARGYVLNSATDGTVKGTDSLAVYANHLAEARRTGRTATLTAGVGVLLTLILGAVCVALESRTRAHRHIDEAKLATLLAGEPDKELFELNLRKKTIRAYGDFKTFGVAPGSIPESLSLKKLSMLLGYDFEEHYAGVSLHGNTIYRNRMIIHVGGQKLYITEEGRRTGHILMITMTKLG